MPGRVYRFQEIDTGWYLCDKREGATPKHSEAGLFTLFDWEAWGKDGGGYRLVEPTPTEEMTKSGAAMLPGFGGE